MNKKGIFLLVLIFCFMYALNTLKPLSSDDYFATFIWNTGASINEFASGSIQKVSGISDILHNFKMYYLTWGGRIPGGSPIVFFVLWGKEYFNPLNALMMTLLVAEIYWLSHEGIITLDFDSSYVIWIFFSLWAFNVSFNDTCLWLSGSCNYLWMLVLVLFFLIPYVQNYYDINRFKCDRCGLTTGMFFLGVLAGWSHETTTCWLAATLLCWIFLCKKSNNLQYWKVSGFIGLCIGYALLVFAPGNFSRLQLQQNTTSIIISSELLKPKLIEVSLILIFHLFLWYFIIKFFFNYNNIKALKESGLYLNFAKVCSLIAFCSGVFMFFIPSNGLRPSFLGLVFLIIAAASLFRLQGKEGHFILNLQARSFLKAVGYCYFIFTMTVSLWCNYINWSHWNSILALIKTEQKNPSQTILEVKPYFTDKNFMLWLVGTGFHLIHMPITEDEKDNINVTVAKFYGIKGIKVVD